MNAVHWLSKLGEGGKKMRKPSNWHEYHWQETSKQPMVFNDKINPYKTEIKIFQRLTCL